MSVSSSEGPEFNRFYDESSAYSEGLSVDSFVDRTVHERREKADKAKRRHEAALAARQREGAGFGGSSSPFSSILASFRNCCAPISRKADDDATSPALGLAEERGGFLPAGLLGDVSANGVKKAAGEVAPGLAQHLRAAGQVVKRTSSADTSSDTSKTISTVIGPGAGRPLDNADNDHFRLVDWRIELDKNASKSLVLTPEQKSWCVAVWALRMENSERMNTKMLAEVLAGADQQKETVNVSAVLKHEKQFYPLDCLRCIEARTVQDVLGDVMGLFNELSDAGAVYTILSKVRVLGIYARKQGETTDVVVFDPLPPESEGFGPNFVGFNSLEDMEAFVEGIFSKDQQAKKASGMKFSAWLMRSRVLYGASPYAKNYGKASPTTEKDWKAEEKARKKDEKYDAKLVYTSLYKAADTPTTDEKLFTWAPGLGMQIDTQRAATQQRQVDTVEEMDETQDPEG